MGNDTTPASGGRKRAHDDPPPATTDDALSVGKKRRLNTTEDQAVKRSTSFGSALSSAVQGFLWGRQRGNTDKDAAYDNVPGSNEDEKKARLASIRSPSAVPAVKYNKFRAKTPASAKRSVSASASASASAPTNIYDVPDSGDELQGAPSPTKQAAIKTTAKGRASSSSKPRSSQKPPSGRNAQSDEQDKPPPKRRGRPPKNKPIEGTPTISRFKDLENTASPGLGTPKLKGILSPQKNRSVRPQKSVVFDSQTPGKSSEVFFEDLPSKSATKPSARKLSTAPAIKVGTSQANNAAGTSTDANMDSDDDEDDEVCAVCSKPDSRKPNEILFCENCDRGFHQKCYDVPVIPEGDWICRDCSQEDALPNVDKAAKLEKSSNFKPVEVPKIPNLEQHLRAMQRVLLDRCTGNRRIRLSGQDEAFDKAFQLVEQTVLAGEGNSMMVIGARGSGKSTLVNSVIDGLSDHRDQFHVVRLSGFIHTDDKLALRDIWRQLGKEMEIDDDLVNKPSNYADTMASLLALLSHPAEITGTEEGVTSRSVVFIIDEFDLFASHARQTLLYNLFDIAQARKAPIAVLGLTTRVDVVESLEKRVKSRFSHRYVYMSLPKTLQGYWEICRQGLCIDDEDYEREGLDTDLEGFYDFQEYWNAKLEDSRKSPSFQDHLEYLYYTGKSVQAFLTSCVVPLSMLSMSSLALKMPGSSTLATTLTQVESRSHLLEALSDLELALLISAARLDIVAHTDTINFSMAYDEYSSQMGKQRVQTASSGMLALGGGARLWGRGIATVAWERLVTLGLLIPASIGARSNSIHGGLEGKMWKLDVSLEEIPTATPLPAFLAKWCTHI